MSSFQDVDKFKRWATKMGCPLEHLPSDDVLRRTFTTKQGRCLLEVTRRIAPVAVLTDIRHNILLHKLRTYHSAMADHVPEQHPAEIQRMIRVRELRAERQRLQEKIASKKAALDAVRSKMAENGRNSSRTNVEVRIARANAGMLAAKLRSLDDGLHRERTIAETIVKLMPVRFNAAIHTAEQAAAAIDHTMATLQEHYAEMASNGDATPLNTSSDIWSRLTRHVANVSNATLWSQIGAVQTRNVDAIKQLCAEATRLKQLSANSATDQKARCQFKVFLTRARTKHIGLELRMAALETEYDSDASELYDVFSTRVHTQCQRTASVADQYDEMAVEKYILELMASLMLKGHMDFLNSELAIIQREYDSKSKSLTDHTELLAKLQSVYAESEITINETRDAGAALSVIKAKLQDLEQTSRKLVQDRRTGSQQQQQASQAQRRLHNATINSTLTGNAMDVSQSSFNFSRSDLCSTRLEDAAESPAIGSPMKQKQSCAPHVAELNAYLDVQLGHLMQSTASGDTLQQYCADNMPHNGLLKTDLYSVMALVQHAERIAEWQANVEVLLTDQHISMVTAEIDEADLRAQHSVQLNRLAELRDKCDLLTAALPQKQQLVDRLCAFLVDNSLRQFIPASKTFSGRSYQDYEGEFMSHYNIVMAGAEPEA